MCRIPYIHSCLRGLLAAVGLCAVVAAGLQDAWAANVYLTSPQPGEVYVAGDTMTIEIDTVELSASEQAAGYSELQFFYQWSGSSESHSIGYLVSMSQDWDGMTYDWTVPSVTETSYLQIEVRVAGLDLAAIPGTLTRSVKIIPSTSTASVYLTHPQPARTEDLVFQGGDETTITWDITGCAGHSGQDMTISLTTNGGGSYEDIATVSPCDAGHGHSWTVPSVETTQARVRLQWGALDESESAYDFAITLAPVVNQRPVANAGPDQSVGEGSEVHLTGAASSDPDGDSLVYSWERVDGWQDMFPFTLLDGEAMTPHFTAPDPGVDEVTFVFELTVADPDGLEDSDRVRVTVSPAAMAITTFTPFSGWFKTPITLYGDNMAGSNILMHGERVTDWRGLADLLIPPEGDAEYTYYLPELDPGSTPIGISNISGSFTSTDDFLILPVPYQWDWGFQFVNPHDYDMSWGDYENCYGYNAVTWERICCDWDWDDAECRRRCHDPIAQALFDSKRSVGGSCFGMSVASLKFAHGSYEPLFGLPVREYEWSLDPETEIARRVKMNHFSQYSAEVLAYKMEHMADLPSETVRRIQADLEAGQVGFISIKFLESGLDTDDIRGHAMNIDRVEQTGADAWRIYVYDSNRPGRSTARDVEDTSRFGDLTDPDTYPYIVVERIGSDESWYFDMTSGRWDASTDYSISIGGLGSIPYYGLIYQPFSLVNRERFTLPWAPGGLGLLGRALLSMVTGSADQGLEDSGGNLTGYDASGRLHFDIPSAIPLTPSDESSFRETEAYLLPDGSYQARLYGNGEGTYEWSAASGGSLAALEDVQVHAGSQDNVEVGQGAASMKFRTNDPVKGYSAKLARTLGDGARRIYEVLGSSLGTGEEADFRVSSDDNALLFANNSARTVNFGVRFTAVQLGPQPEPPDTPPSSSRSAVRQSGDVQPVENFQVEAQNLQIPPNTTLSIQPSDWTDLASATVVAGGGEVPPDDPCVLGGKASGGQVTGAIDTSQCPVFTLKLSREPSAPVRGRLYVAVKAVSIPDLAPYTFFRPADEDVPLPEGGYVKVVKGPEGYLSHAADFPYCEGEMGGDDLIFKIGTGGFGGHSIVCETLCLEEGATFDDPNLTCLQQVNVAFE